jgi:hypothetical protein
MILESKLSLTLLFIGMMGDIITTFIGLSITGVIERNPIPIYFFSNNLHFQWFIMYFFLYSIIFVQVSLVNALKGYSWLKGFSVFWVSMLGFLLIFITINNAIQIIQTLAQIGTNL